MQKNNHFPLVNISQVLFIIVFITDVYGQALKESKNYLYPDKINSQGSLAFKPELTGKINNYTLSNTNSAGVTGTAAPDLTLFGNFGNNILNSFKGNNIYFHLAGIASSYLLVTQDVDYHVERYFNEHEGFGNFTRPVLITGAFLPFVVGGGLFAYAKAKNDDETLGASYAVLQASLIEFLYNSTLKAFTGRANPDWRHNADMDSLSKTFNFGFMRGGIFWGWPSGHTSSTMAVVAALTNYYPDKLWLKIAGYSLVAYTILGVSSINRGGMHWFSDGVAAAFMAYAIGSTVGKYYRSVYSFRIASASKITNENPSLGFNPLGINLSFQF